MEGNDAGLSRVTLVAAVCVALAAVGSYAMYRRGQTVVPAAAPAAHVDPPTASRAEPSVLGGRSLSVEQRNAMLAKLREEDGSSPVRQVWFATVFTNPEAAAFQRVLEGVFVEAGWLVRSNVPVTFRLKPGIFIFAADEEPPAYVSTAVEAFNAAEITVSVGRGYRDFYAEKKRDNPNWNGFEMTPDQTYVAVVGPQPPQ